MRWGKVALREKRMDDVIADYTWKKDVELSRLDAVEPLMISFYDYSVDYAEELQHTSPTRQTFAIETLEGRHIGNCMYYGLDRGEAEVGILIGDPDYWGRGYGTDAMHALLDHLFGRLGLERVYLHTLDWNERAQKSFLKSGFLPCGRVRREGKQFIIMELRRPRWELLRLMPIRPDRHGKEA